MLIKFSLGILCLRFNKLPVEIDLDPARPIVRSSFISMGYLLRKAICDYLDIDLSELNVDFRVVSDGDNKGELFFSDAMENGSGFCRFIFDQKKEFRKQLLEIFTDHKINSKFQRIFQSHQCFLACYDCIKDYSNLFYHDLLNWRLGLDMIYLAQDNKCKINFALPHWHNLIINHFSNVKNLANPIVERNSKKFIVHPLWSDIYIQQLKSKYHIENYEEISIFTFIADYKGINPNTLCIENVR